MALKTFFKPEQSPETLQFNPIEPGETKVILDFLNQAYFTECEPDDSGAKVIIVRKRILKVRNNQTFLPNGTDFSQYPNLEIPLAATKRQPAFHRKLGWGLLMFQHISPHVSFN